MAKEYLDKDGLLYFWQKIKNLFAVKADSIKNITRSGTTFTATRADGTTFTFTQQDNNTTYNDATQSAHGLMSAADKTKLDGIESGAQKNTVTGIKGNSESSYRTGNVNITPANIGLGNVNNTADANKSVASAAKLTMARTIDGVSFDGSADIIHYGRCQTAAATATKVIDCPGFVIQNGAWILVSFVNVNTATTTLCLNVNGTGAKVVRYKSDYANASNCPLNFGPYLFVYSEPFDAYLLAGDVDTNTTYTPASVTPKMDGTAAVGTSAKYAREDHVHPSDTNKVDKVSGKGLSTNDYTTAEKNKLAGIAAGAEKNVNGYSGVVADDTENDSISAGSVSDSFGIYGDGTYITTRTIPAGSDYPAGIEIDLDNTKVLVASLKGAANGVCPLNASKKIDATYLPSYVDDVIEAYARSGQTALSSGWLSATSGGAALTPETGKIYVLMADSGDYSANSQFRWSGTAYVKLADGGVSSITNAEIDAIVAA